MANPIVRTANIDISPGTSVKPVVDINQYDAGVKIVLTVYDDGVLMDLRGYYANVLGVKADKHVFIYSIVCDEHTVTIETTPQMTAVFGDTECEVRIYDGLTDTGIGTGNFILAVEANPLQYAGDFSDDDIPGILEIHKALAAASHAEVSAEAAAESESNAATSETNAANSASAASTSESNAATSESNAAQSATDAANSASAASTSESNAATSESGAAQSATNAANSASAAATSAANAAISETNAANSASAAATSATNAANSATVASTSESNAATSATNAANSASDASTSESNAAQSATDAANSATAAAGSATNAANSATAAATSAAGAEAAKQAIENLSATAVSLESGTPASVEKTITPQGNVNFEFGIPKGDTGAAGPQGPKGDPGEDGDVPVVECTQAEYDALPESEKTKNILYCITDGIPVAIAQEVYYDNTDSGLSSNRVQGAIDENVTAIGENTKAINRVGHPDAFSTAKSYAEGDYCIQNDVLYTCVSPVTAGSAFNSSQWVPLSLWDLINEPEVDMGTISSLPVTKSVDGLPVGFKVKRMYLSNSAAQTSEWDITTAWDSVNECTTITISGTISGSTTVTLWFGPVKPLTAA